MPFEHYRYAGTQRLRCGYTTGTCAALAASAATEALLGGTFPLVASLMTPSGIVVEAVVENPSLVDGVARCGIRKDAGDDVDATDGILVFASADLSDIPDVPDSSAAFSWPHVKIDGGPGVGRITKPGLDQPVGAAAINSGPRAMIEKAVLDTCALHGYTGRVGVVIDVPDGERAALDTFNPHLGIEGGISILGTSGIVEPRSLTAVMDTIELQIRSLAAEGKLDIAIAPGNYGVAFAHELGLPDAVPLVECSNFIGHALDCCAREGFSRILLVGHIGKLAKVAGGIMDTHSRIADCRVEVVAAHAAACGASQECACKLFECATTDACLDVLETERAGLVDEVADRIATAVQERLERRIEHACTIGAVIFSRQHDLLKATPEALRIMDAWGMGTQGGQDDV